MLKRFLIDEMPDEEFSKIMVLNMKSMFWVIHLASNVAVSTFTRELALELALNKFQFNAFSLGIILTPFHDMYTNSTRLQRMMAQIPLVSVGPTRRSHRS